MPLAQHSLERSAPPKDLEVRPKHVKAWIDTLPIARSAEAARSASGHLAALNRVRIDADDRVQILESYRPIASLLLEELAAVYGKAAMPMPARAREALTAARDLAAALAEGFAIAADEKAAKRLGFGTRKQLPALIGRAIEYLAAVQCASYRSYTPVPPGVWAQMHQLYLHAERDGIAAEPIDENGWSVASIYCEALLLSLTDPYRLVQGEADKVVTQVRGARAAVTLGTTRPDTRPGAHFIVPCDTDKPPKPALSANDDTGGPNWRLFDATAIVEKLRMRKQAAESGQVSATMSRSLTPEVLNLLGKLLVLWGDPPKRAARRDAKQGTVAVCVGIRAIGHFVCQQPPLPAGKERDALRKGITMPLVPLPMDDGEQAVPIFEWDIVNASAGGLKLRRMGPTNPLAVGDVVGIKLEDRRGWIAGAVRWITAFEEGGMEFGVQFLGEAVRMVWVQPTITHSAQARQGLVLADPEEPFAETLLAPTNTYSDLREFELQEDGHVSVVRATGLVEKTARFELFQISAS